MRWAAAAGPRCARRASLERTRDQLAALRGSCGYTLVRDTPLDRILPWRILQDNSDP